jgi:hypothetical protein
MQILRFITLTATLGASIPAGLAQASGPSLATIYGSGSYVSVVFGSNGVLYGTGKSGTVFELAPPPALSGPWTESVLHTFTGQNGDGTPTRVRSEARAEHFTAQPRRVARPALA